MRRQARPGDPGANASLVLTLWAGSSQDLVAEEPGSDIIIPAGLWEGNGLVALRYKFTHLAPERRKVFSICLNEYSPVFVNVPSVTTCTTHDTDVSDARPVKILFL